MKNNIIEFIMYNRSALNLIGDLVPIPLFMKDNAGRYIACNDAFAKFFSFSREEIIGKSVYDIWSKDEADVFFYQDKLLLTQGGLQIYEGKITSSDGIGHIVQFHKQTFADSAGETAGFLGAIFDITEKKKLEKNLVELATIDELTHLPNRRDGLTALAVLHADSVRKKRAYCLAMIDIDHFKRLNDRYGHVNGDFVLREFADLSKNILRSSDVCFRYGGEEFVLLLPETEMNEGFIVAERLRQAWARKQLTLPDGQTAHSTVSIGIAQYPKSAASADQLLQRSDWGLYDAKNNGRNCTVRVQTAENEEFHPNRQIFLQEG